MLQLFNCADVLMLMLQLFNCSINISTNAVCQELHGMGFQLMVAQYFGLYSVANEFSYGLKKI